MTALRPSVAGAIAAAMGCGLLLANTAERRAGVELAELRLSRRYWEDMAVATSRYLNRVYPPRREPIPLQSWERALERDKYRRFIIRASGARRIRPWEPWKSIPPRRFGRMKPIELRLRDDVGRARLLETGFRALGGISPFLGLWLAALICLLPLAWLCFELASAGHSLAAALFAVTLATSAFVVDVLSLAYSAVGFQVVGLVAVAALAAHAFLGRPPRPAGFLFRTLLAGVLFGLCVLCRSGTITLLPGFGIALAWAWWRIAAGNGRGAWLRFRAFGLLLAACALLLAPYAAVRPPNRHEHWVAFWSGLGDFDRSKGHTWTDIAARQALWRRGVELDHWAEFTDPENQLVLRDEVIEHILGDPLWYGQILGKRALVTASQWKLWPWGPRDGHSMRPRGHPQEGVIDEYYRMTATVDIVGFGGRELELPVLVLLAPTLAVIAAWAAFRWLIRRDAAERRLRPVLALLGCVAVSASIQPILVTTASALETEGFALVYFLGFAFCVEAAVLALVGPGGLSGAKQ